MDGKAFFRSQPRHPNVDAGLLGVSLRVFSSDLAQPAGYRVEQIRRIQVMVLRHVDRAELLECSPLHRASIMTSNSSPPTSLASRLQMLVNRAYRLVLPAALTFAHLARAAAASLA